MGHNIETQIVGHTTQDEIEKQATDFLRIYSGWGATKKAQDGQDFLKAILNGIYEKGLEDGMEQEKPFEHHITALKATAARMGLAIHFTFSSMEKSDES